MQGRMETVMEYLGQAEEQIHYRESKGKHNMQKDEELRQHQILQNDSTSCQTEILLYQLIQQQQQESFELKRELMSICVHLNNLAERQEQQRHLIHYSQEQVLNEIRQHFNFLSSLLINKAKSPINSEHLSFVQESQLRHDHTVPSTRDGNISAILSMPSQNLENGGLLNEWGEERTFTIGSDNIVRSDNHNVATSVKINPVKPSGDKQGGAVPETSEKEQYLDPSLHWQNGEQNAWRMDRENETLGIGIRQNSRPRAVNEQDKFLLTARGQKDHMTIRHNHIASETTEATSGPLHTELNLPKASLDSYKDEQIGKIKNVDRQNEKQLNKNEKKGMPQFLSESDKDLGNTDGLKEQIKSLDQNHSHKMYADAVSAGSTRSTMIKMTPSSKENILDKSTHLSDSPMVPETQESFEGTGFYAEAISKLMSSGTLPPEGFAQSGTNSDSQYYNRLARQDSSQSGTTSSKASTLSSPVSCTENSENNQIQRPVEYIPESGAIFKIFNCNQFSVSRKVILTQYMYTHSKACKVRVRIGFNTAGQLKAYVHVARSVFDEEHKWPMSLSGSGLVQHNGSKFFIPIWQLHATSCQKPLSDKDVILPTVVCLSSSKNAYPDVTFKDLEKMQYAGNNCLIFKWNLKAEEN